MNPLAAEELAVDCRVMRVCELKPAFFPDRASAGRFVATPQLFEVSSVDKEDARRRNTETMLSVFDRQRTTLLEAKSLRRIDAANENVAGFSLTVEAIKQAASRYISHRAVRVLRDPYTDERAQEPGGDGHSGITSTDRRDGEDRNSYRAFRTELARLCAIVRCDGGK